MRARLRRPSRGFPKLAKKRSPNSPTSAMRSQALGARAPKQRVLSGFGDVGEQVAGVDHALFDVREGVRRRAARNGVAAQSDS